MQKTSKLVLGLCIGLLTVVGAPAYADAPIQILIDGRSIPSDVAAHIENGRTMVPLRAISEALGATVDWRPDAGGGGTVVIHTYPREFSSAFGSVQTQRSSPADLNAFGAASSLTQFLAAQQAASGQNGDPRLVRFDLLDVRDWCNYSPPADLRNFCAGGFLFAVRLYYVQVKDPSIPATVARYQRVSDATIVSTGPASPQVASSWYEDVTFDVHPKGAPQYSKDGGRETVTYGADGWDVDQASRALIRKVTLSAPPFLIHGSFGR